MVAGCLHCRGKIFVVQCKTTNIFPPRKLPTIRYANLTWCKCSNLVSQVRKVNKDRGTIEAPYAPLVNKSYLRLLQRGPWTLVGSTRWLQQRGSHAWTMTRETQLGQWAKNSWAPVRIHTQQLKVSNSASIKWQGNLIAIRREWTNYQYAYNSNMH